MKTNFKIFALLLWGGVLVVNSTYSQLTLNQSGNVGVGTLNPETSSFQTMDIYGTNTAKLAILSGPVSDLTNSVSFLNSNVLSGLWSIHNAYNVFQKGGLTGTQTNHPFSIITNYVPRITISETGNVSVGTSIPQSLGFNRSFQVYDNENSIIYTSNNRVSTGMLSSNDALYGSMYDGGYFGTFTNHSLTLITNSKQRFLIDHNGTSSFISELCNLSISCNRTSPRIYSNKNTINFVNYSGSVPQKIFGGLYTKVSDIRLKTDIKFIKDGLKKITKLNGINFYWKYDTLKTELNSGLIAQSVEKIIPELVLTMDDSLKTKTIDYDGLIPYLIEAVKELNAVNEKQNKKICELEKKIQHYKWSYKKSGTENETVSDTLINSIDIEQSSLFQNIPNPFRENTLIKYYLAEDIGNAVLYIYDMNGKQIKSFLIGDKGEGSIIIYGNELYAGMFIYSLIADGQIVDTKRMVLTE